MHSSPKSTPTRIPSWQKHGQVSAMWSTLRYLQLLRPVAGCIENVLGLQYSKEGDVSPLALIQGELAKADYEPLPLQLNLSSFHAVNRDRPRQRMNGKPVAPPCSIESRQLVFDEPSVLGLSMNHLCLGRTKPLFHPFYPLFIVTTLVFCPSPL